MIEALPTELVERLPSIKDYWIAVGLSTGATDRNAAEAAMAKVYQCGGLKPPQQFLWFQSPLQGALASTRMCSEDQVGGQIRGRIWTQVWEQVWEQVVEQLMDQVGEQASSYIGEQVLNQIWAQVTDQDTDQVGIPVEVVYGQHDTHWLSFYSVFQELIPEIKSKLEGLIQLAHYAGWCWPFRDVVIMTEKPVYCAVDSEGELHSSSRKALEYADGWGLYRWHGAEVPEEAILHPEQITAEQIESATSKDLRQALFCLYIENEADHYGALDSVSVQDFIYRLSSKVMLQAGKTSPRPSRALELREQDPINQRH